MAASTGATVSSQIPASREEIVNESVRLAQHLTKYGFNTITVTLGGLGVLVVREGSKDEPLRMHDVHPDHRAPLSARLYSPPVFAEKPLNVSGAGDCFAAALAVGYALGFPEWRSVAWGIAAAGVSLQSPLAVPSQLQNLVPPEQLTLDCVTLPLA